MSTPVPDITQCRELLRKARLQVRRHRALIKEIDGIPDRFLVSNGRQLIRDTLNEAMATVRTLESRIAEFESALAAAHRKR